jgi:hypothetical protein
VALDLLSRETAVQKAEVFSFYEQRIIVNTLLTSVQQIAMFKNIERISFMNILVRGA